MADRERILIRISIGSLFNSGDTVEEFKKVHSCHEGCLSVRESHLMVLLRPTYLIDGDVTSIDLAQLKADGIKGLIFDLDSTLLAPHSGRLTSEVESWLVHARQDFKLAIVSNNQQIEYLDKVRELLQIPLIGRAAKPRRKAFFEVLKMFELSAQEVAVIGDRPLTDILGGLRAGMKTVLVWPLKTQIEPEWVKMIRKLERCVIRP